MYRFIPLGFTAVLAGSAISTPAAGAQQLSYGIPAPATATYQVLDSTNMAIRGTPMGPVDIRGVTSFAYTLTFASGGDGVQVTAELSAFEARMSDPMGAVTSMSQAMAGVSSSFEVVLAPRGLGDVVTAPRRTGSDLLMLVDPHEVAFPTLPAGEANAGDMWVDTVTVVVGDGGDRRIVYTYTLEGEVTHNGRPHLRVGVTGESTMTMGDVGMVMNLTGTETGHYLWDIERGLMSSSEVSRSNEGSTTAPDGSAISLRVTATTRLTLEN